MLVELSAERDRYLALSKSSAAASAVAELEAERASSLTKSVKDLQTQLSTAESRLQALQHEKTAMEAEHNTQLAAAAQTQADMKQSLATEQQRHETLASQASEVERRLQAVTAEAEAERRRCLELQAGLGAQSSE
jgi:predicted  nucleic acid-binding Zn-ribbon protein